MREVEKQIFKFWLLLNYLGYFLFHIKWLCNKTWNSQNKYIYLILLLKEHSHITSSLKGGEGRRMMTLVIFLMENNSNIYDEGGEGQKGHFHEDENM